MKHPNIKTKVVHSESKSAWNVVATEIGNKYKIARIPYNQLTSKDTEIYNTREKAEALELAMFISYCFNNKV